MPHYDDVNSAKCALDPRTRRYAVEAWIPDHTASLLLDKLEPYGFTYDLFHYLLSVELMCTSSTLLSQSTFHLSQIDLSTTMDFICEQLDVCMGLDEFRNSVINFEEVQYHAFLVIELMVNHYAIYVGQILLQEKLRLLSALQYHPTPPDARAVEYHISIDHCSILHVSRTMVLIDVTTALE